MVVVMVLLLRLALVVASDFLGCAGILVSLSIAKLEIDYLLLCRGTPTT